MKQTTNTPKPRIGDVLFFRQHEFNSALSSARKLYPAIEKLMAAYADLGLPEAFTTDTLHELLTAGTDHIRQQLEQATLQDLAQFRSPLLKNQVAREVQPFLTPLDKAVRDAKLAIKDAVNGGRGVSVTDFRIEDGKPVFVEDGLRERYTVRIENERQAEVFAKLRELVTCYNESVQMIKPSGLPLGTYGLFHSFVNRKYLGHSDIGLPIIADEIEVTKEALTAIH